MWIIQVSFIIWCKVTQCASSRYFKKLYLSTFDILLLTWTKKHLRRNKQLTNLVHSNVKTYRPFWASAIVSRVFLGRKIQKLYLFEIIKLTHFSQLHVNVFLWINKQLINLEYNDMKNLTYILISCKCVQN